MAVTLKPIKQSTFSFWIKGMSPLIQHAWSQKGLDMMRMTAAERKKQVKTARNPEELAEGACYYTDDGEHGIPLLAFKASLISAAHKDFGLEKTLLRKAFFIPSTDSGSVTAMETDGPYIIREDIVRVGANQTDLRYRPQFNSWRVNIVCQVDSELLKDQDIVNLVNRAGFSVGIGDWRPEKGGEFGRFEFDTSMPIEEVEI